MSEDWSQLNVILAPLVRALEIATEKSSFDQNLLQPSISTPAPVQASGILGFLTKFSVKVEFWTNSIPETFPNTFFLIVKALIHSLRTLLDAFRAIRDDVSGRG